MEDSGKGDERDDGGEFVQDEEGCYVRYWGVEDRSDGRAEESGYYMNLLVHEHSSGLRGTIQRLEMRSTRD